MQGKRDFNHHLFKGVFLMDNRPIGVLDSGLGGLTVLKKVIEDVYKRQDLCILKLQRTLLTLQPN